MLNQEEERITTGAVPLSGDPEFFGEHAETFSLSAYL
jgi:hypothetical protein